MVALHLQIKLGKVVQALQIGGVLGPICSGTHMLIIHIEKIKIRSLSQAEINLRWIKENETLLYS